MDWDRLKIFHAIAEAGSFSGAAAYLKMSPSAVSRHIHYLEDQLQTSLFFRHARGIELTEQGEFLFEAAQEIFSELIFVRALLADKQEFPKGVLKIHSPPIFGILALSFCLGEFIDLYADLCIKLYMDHNNEKSINFKEVDIAIHTEPIFYAGLISVPILKQSLRIYASRRYLEKFGVPFKPHHLDHHRLICFDNGTTSQLYGNLLLELGANAERPRYPFLSINSILGVAQAVEDGVGIGLLAPYVVSHLKDVVQLFPEIPAPTVEYYLVYPEQLKKTSRIQALQSFILEKIKPLGEDFRNPSL